MPMLTMSPAEVECHKLAGRCLAFAASNTPDPDRPVALAGMMARYRADLEFTAQHDRLLAQDGAIDGVMRLVFEAARTADLSSLI